jgi:hypothetical protein
LARLRQGTKFDDHGSSSFARKEILMSSSSPRLPSPQGTGAVPGAPNLPAGFTSTFTSTFTSQYVDTGELRQHVVTGGQGPPLLLVHGWPQTWYAWRLVMPALGPRLLRGSAGPARPRAVRQT